MFIILRPFLYKCESPISFFQVTFESQKGSSLHISFQSFHFRTDYALYSFIIFIFCTFKMSEHLSISFSTTIFNDHTVAIKWIYYNLIATELLFFNLQLINLCPFAFPKDSTSQTSSPE